MRTNKKPTITYASNSETESWDPLLHELNAKGFFCMFQRKMAEGVTMGGGTDDYFILDVGTDWARHAAGIMKGTPKLAGRVVVIGKPPDDSASLEGIIFSTRADLIKTIESIHGQLGQRDLDA